MQRALLFALPISLHYKTNGLLLWCSPLLLSLSPDIERKRFKSSEEVLVRHCVYLEKLSWLCPDWLTIHHILHSKPTAFYSPADNPVCLRDMSSLCNNLLWLQCGLRIARLLWSTVFTCVKEDLPKELRLKWRCMRLVVYMICSFVCSYHMLCNTYIKCQTVRFLNGIHHTHDWCLNMNFLLRCNTCAWLATEDEEVGGSDGERFHIW